MEATDVKKGSSDAEPLNVSWNMRDVSQVKGQTGAAAWSFCHDWVLYLHVKNQRDLLHHVVVQQAFHQDLWTVDAFKTEILILVLQRKRDKYYVVIYVNTLLLNLSTVDLKEQNHWVQFLLSRTLSDSTAAPSRRLWLRSVRRWSWPSWAAGEKNSTSNLEPELVYSSKCISTTEKNIILQSINLFTL